MNRTWHETQTDTRYITIMNTGKVLFSNLLILIVAMIIADDKTPNGLAVVNKSFRNNFHLSHKQTVSIHYDNEFILILHVTPHETYFQRIIELTPTFEKKNLGINLQLQ